MMNGRAEIMMISAHLNINFRARIGFALYERIRNE
ncbi:hypothetical protein F480_10060 [Bibersteinia trehalosi Y31]|uniref:Uncharacterized protein n=1 Tax=Bibersteinia trehalosi Y31 TaxID=1261658 RepID=A0A179D0C8_BIBTR|nr:hypothetical protein F480_10060 [Bibersteinia trehalosi Y31]